MEIFQMIQEGEKKKNKVKYHAWESAIEKILGGF